MKELGYKTKLSFVENGVVLADNMTWFGPENKNGPTDDEYIIKKIQETLVK